MTLFNTSKLRTGRFASRPARGLAIIVFLTAFIWLAAALSAVASEPRPLARTILALYDGERYPDVRATLIHRLAEMPLNHLGLKVRYHDIHAPLPAAASLDDVRGVLTWFEDDKTANPEALVNWAETVVERGIRWVIVDDLGIHRDREGKDTSTVLVNRYLALLGLGTDGRWKTPTYDVKLAIRTPDMVEFERPYQGILPAFLNVRKESPALASHLGASWGLNGAHRGELVVTGPRGGYVQSGYFAEVGEGRVAWLVNPFEFFRRSFATDEVPKPDTTTLSGRRIYYSHIDGDGWRNPTEIERYPGKLSTEVIYREALAPYGDLPVTVSAIAGDLDPEWYGSTAARELAREIFALPQVEVATHTYSHPFDWSYFGDGYKPEDEWRDHWSQRPESDRWRTRYPQAAAESPQTQGDLQKGGSLDYDTPRAYGNFPYDLEREIGGSARALEPLLPKNKKVSLVLWTGDTRVGEAALKEAARLGMKNMNGGDTRFDSEYPSCGWVSPIGVETGGGIQIYASASNENNYTHLWQDRFYGFRHLQQTLKNTESPRRLKPMNIYYHMYSGQKEASLRALLENLNYARSEKIAPVSGSHYAALAEGFYSTEMLAIGPSEWQIRKRGKLSTLRFDDSEAKAVDFSRSRGVIGQRHYQGSLYVALDAAVEEPVVALKGHPAGGPLPASSRPYLLEGRWNIWDLSTAQPRQAQFTAQGYGPGAMRWKVPREGLYRVSIESDDETQTSITAQASPEGVLEFTVNAPALTPVRITIQTMDDVL